MRKIPSLFKREMHGDRRCYNEVTEGCEWVLEGVGIPTEKYDGTACMVQDGKLYKRYDRRLKSRGAVLPVAPEDFRAAPSGWVPCEPGPTGFHWPGWLPVGDGPEDKWHRSAGNWIPEVPLGDGTYELVGPKVQRNPYRLTSHFLWFHGVSATTGITMEHTFEGIRDFLERYRMRCMGSWIPVEGFVWWDGNLEDPTCRLAKVKRCDFGLEWPPSPDNRKGD